MPRVGEQDLERMEQARLDDGLITENDDLITEPVSFPQTHDSRRIAGDGRGTR